MVVWRLWLVVWSCFSLTRFDVFFQMFYIVLLFLGTSSMIIFCGHKNTESNKTRELLGCVLHRVPKGGWQKGGC